MAGLFYYLTVFSPWPPLCEAPDGGVWACPALGASGAVYAILGACAMLLPEMVVYLWFFPVKMRYAWIIWMLIEIVGAVSPGTGIANAAHLGGLIFGLIYGWYLSKKEQAFYQPTWETRDTTWEQA
jgi:membrane associated rhomboid family serine protease